MIMMISSKKKADHDDHGEHCDHDDLLEKDDHDAGSCMLSMLAAPVAAASVAARCACGLRMLAACCACGCSLRLWLRHLWLRCLMCLHALQEPDALAEAT